MDHIIQESGPTVKRPDEIREAFTAVHQAEIDRLIEAPWKDHAETNARAAAVERRAYAPILRIVEQDADAEAASQELVHLRGKARAAQEDALPVSPTRSWDAQVRDAFKGVKQGINVFGRPYDWEIRDPVHNAGEAIADKNAGTFETSVVGYYGSGASWATAGVGVALKATIDGVARIAPPMSDTWWWSIDATLFSANTYGLCKVVVQDPVSGAVLGPQGERTIQLWNHTSQTGASGNGFGSFFASDIAPTVTLAAGQVFNVSFLASVFTDQSGSLAFGHSYADCRLGVSLPFFVVHMNV
ncbi:hypothetical protein [Streptomyces sp. TRM70350]|uniref:hypothetical protein n=1 Tax=Streptomyces sp. TRM70350 TaxID=2856165 RepID=UPI001C477B67|nr:hypothetical protein [Streptomyces sp. TRM70350]MBV7698759.1 hypothetical protein [Streptomyces sp. TRM70350]